MNAAWRRGEAILHHKGRNIFYKVMPFELKNIETINRWLVDKVFESQIGWNMEVYIEDMLIKSPSPGDHITNLGKTFEVLQLNLTSTCGA